MTNTAPSAGLVSEDDIALLVDEFYSRVRSDPVLGPIFARHVGDTQEAWAEHLATLRNFWSSVMLTSGRYKGDPFSTHLRMDELEPEMFERWLALFREACATLFPDSRSRMFEEKAQRIAQSLRLGLFERLPAAAREVDRNGAPGPGRSAHPGSQDDDGRHHNGS